MHTITAASTGFPSHHALLSLAKRIGATEVPSAMAGRYFVDPGFLDSVLIVGSGAVQVLRLSVSGGNEWGVDLLRAGDIFGLDPEEWYDFPKELEAVGVASVMRASRAALLSGMRDGRHLDPAAHVRARARRLSRRLSWAHLQVSDRLPYAYAELLDDPSEKDGEWRPLLRGLNQEKIARYVGTCRETIARMNSELRRRGLFRKVRKGVHYVHRDHLSAVRSIETA